MSRQSKRAVSCTDRFSLVKLQQLVAETKVCDKPLLRELLSALRYHSLLLKEHSRELESRPREVQRETQRDNSEWGRLLAQNKQIVDSHLNCRRELTDQLKDFVRQDQFLIQLRKRPTYQEVLSLGKEKESAVNRRITVLEEQLQHHGLREEDRYVQKVARIERLFEDNEKFARANDQALEERLSQLILCAREKASRKEVEEVITANNQAFAKMLKERLRMFSVELDSRLQGHEEGVRSLLDKLEQLEKVVVERRIDEPKHEVLPIRVKGEIQAQFRSYRAEIISLINERLGDRRTDKENRPKLEQLQGELRELREMLKGRTRGEGKVRVEQLVQELKDKVSQEEMSCNLQTLREELIKELEEKGRTSIQASEQFIRRVESKFSRLVDHQHGNEQLPRREDFKRLQGRLAELAAGWREQEQLVKDLCAENLVGRWAWKSGNLQHGKVPWQEQLVNTFPEGLSFSSKESNVKVVVAGLYRVRVGIFSLQPPPCEVLLNGEVVCREGFKTRQDARVAYGVSRCMFIQDMSLLSVRTTAGHEALLEISRV